MTKDLHQNLLLNLDPANADPHRHVSLEEAAELLGITYKSMSRHVRKYPRIKDYCTKIHYAGRRRTVIKLEGLFILANSKDSDRGNQNKKISPSATFREGKEKIAKTLTKQVNSEVLITVLEVQGNMLKEALSRIERLEGERNKPLFMPLPQADGEPAPLDLRALINKRIRVYAQENDFEYYVVWGRLFEEMYYRYHVNIKRKAEVRRCKYIEVVEAEGLLDEAWKLACKIFPVTSDRKKYATVG